MADERPMIRVLDFKTTYENRPKKAVDLLNDKMDEKGYLLDANGRRVMERVAEDWVVYAPAHSPINTRNVERVRHMIPDAEQIGEDPSGVKLAFMQARWSQIGPAYEAWKAGQEVPVFGTPLGAWPGINEDQIAIFRQVGIRTVEEVRDLSETAIERVRLPNMRDIRSQAKHFLENMGAAAVAQREADRDREIEAMRVQMEEMRQQLAAQAGTPAGSDADEVAALRAECDAIGVEYDKRWAAPRLRSALAAASAAA